MNVSCSASQDGNLGYPLRQYVRDDKGTANMKFVLADKTNNNHNNLVKITYNKIEGTVDEYRLQVGSGATCKSSNISSPAPVSASEPIGIPGEATGGQCLQTAGLVG